MLTGKQSQDALALLHREHGKVKGLFSEALDTDVSQPAALERIAREIAEALTFHTAEEEQIFYPQLKQRAIEHSDDETKEQVFKALEEHAGVENIIHKLSGLSASDETFHAKLAVMKELVEMHVKEEESKMFPEAKRLMTKDELNQLGDEIRKFRERAGAPTS